MKLLIDKIKKILNFLITKYFKKKNYIERFDNEVNKNYSYDKRKELILFHLSKNPNTPYFYLALIANEIRNLKYFSEYNLSNFFKNNKIFFKNNSLTNLDFEFINTGNIIGSVGNCLAIENIVLANLMNLREKKKITIILDKFLKPRNTTLFKYLRKYIEPIESPKKLGVSDSLSKNMEVPIGVGLNFKDDKCFYLSNAANFIYQNKNNGSAIPLLKINQQDLEDGKNLLNEIGVPKNKWYVTLHVREVGYRGETKNNTKEKFRNSDPLRYVDSIKEIVSQGGCVIRVGDPSMSKLPKIEGLIDYCHHKKRSEFLDIFLAATSFFSLATSSGFWTLSRMFGTPVLLTNTSDLNQFFALREKDILLPRLIKNKKDNQLLTFSEMFSFPISMINSDEHLDTLNLETIENTQSDLLYSTKEMLLKCFTKDKAQGSARQDKIKKLSEKIILDQLKIKQVAFASISENFLQENENLIR